MKLVTKGIFRIKTKTENRIKMYLCIVSFAVPFMMMLALCVIRHITPFGDNTFLYLDMKRQYVDFYSYYKSIFTGRNDFLYTFGSALGQSMTGFTSYYLTSPFLIPFIFIDRMQLPEAVTFLCITKIALSGLTSNIYLRVHFGRPCSRASVLFSTSFALSAYMIANMCNIMWLDPIIMLPLILLGLDRISDGRGGIPWLYIISLSISLFTNYYISYMIAIFTVIYFACMIFIRPKKRCGSPKINITDEHEGSRYAVRCLTYVISSLTAVLLVSFILLPTFLDLKSSTKDSLRTGVKITLANQNPFHILTKFLSLSFDNDQIMSGLPHLFCGTAVFLLLIMFFINRSVPRFRKIRAAVMTAVFMVSFSFARIDIMWHAGTEPLGYRYRYAFLLVFVVTACAYEAFEHIGCGTTTVISCVTTLILAAYALCSGETFFDNKRFVINVVLIISESFLIFMYGRLRDTAKGCLAAGNSDAVKDSARSRVPAVIFACIAFMQALDLMGNAFVIYGTESAQQMTSSEFRRYCKTTESALSAIDDKDITMYRVENTSPRSENDSMQFGYNGMTHYDSTNSARSISAIRRIGYEANSVFCEYDTGNTRLADDLIGIRYIISPGLVTDDRKSAFDPENVGGDVPDRLNVVKRKTSLPMAVSFDSENYTGYSDNPFSIQTSIIDGICGYSTGILKQAAVKITESIEPGIKTAAQADAADMQSKQTMKIRVMHYDVMPCTSGDVYFYLTEPYDNPQNIEIECDGTSLGSYANDSDWSVVDLGYRSIGKTFRFDVKLCDDKAQPGKAYFVTEDRNAAANAYSSLKKNFDSVDEISSSHLRITVPDDVSGSSIYLSVPYDPAWHARQTGANGKKLEISDYYGFIRISPCAQVIDMQYIPDGLTAGIIISLITAAALTASWWFHRRIYVF